EIPLADAEADALIVEIPTEPGKTLRRTGVRLESTGERETAMQERLRHHRRWCDRGAVEQRAPCLRTGRSVGGQASRRLERPDGAVGGPPEIAIDRAAIKATLTEAILDHRDFVTFCSAAVERHGSLLKM